MDKANPLRKIIGKVYRTTRGIMLDLNAYYNFIRERSNARKKPKNRKIRVGFIVQYIPAWNKSEALYKLLKSDNRFETYLLCVQNGIKDGILQDKSCEKNDVYDWFVEHGYKEAINTYRGNEKWIDLEELNLDYIFYSRPYNSFMPRQYWSRYVSRYTKICNILYAISLTKGTLSTVFNRDYFRNVYLYFAEFEEIRKVYLKKYWIYSKLGMTNSICIGMPFAKNVLQKKDSFTDSWTFAKGTFRIIWTPRWTTDISAGGSNFFTYKDSILEFAKENQDWDILIRPHPLMFDHFIETGELTLQEKKEYIERVEELKNVSFDFNKDYTATFLNSDVLITDISGIIPEYFVTGKPIIFCDTNFVLQPLDYTKEIFSVSYVAHSEAMIHDYLMELRKGNDPFKEKRKCIINAFLKSSQNAEKKIVENLISNII